MPRLHVLDDVFRGKHVGIPHLDDNLRWLQGFCRTLAGPDWDISVLGAREDQSCDAARLIQALGYPSTTEGWAAARCAPCEAGYAAGLDSFIAADFVLGFGLPPLLINMLLDRKIPFLDIEIDTLRFGPDLFLAVSTNDEALAADFSQSVIAEKALAPALAALLARERRIAPTPGFFHGARVGVFVGQVPHDAAVIADGRIVAPIQFIDRIKEIAAELDLLLIRPHPHWNSIEHLLPILDAVPHAILTQRRSYALLADPSVTDIIALSSGFLAEARLAGKSTHQLMVPDRDRPLIRELRLRQARVSWQTLLNVLMRRLQTPEQTVGSRPDLAVMPLHDLLQVSWGLASASVPEAPELQPAYELHAWAPSFAGALTHGWHPQESWGIWAAEREAMLLLRLPAGSVGGTLRLVFSAAAQTPSGVQVVEVTAGNTAAPVTTRMTAATGWQGCIDFPVSGDMLAAGYIQLRIRSSNFLSPADAGNPDDKRKLGVGMKSVMLLPDAPGRSASATERDGRALGSAYYTSLHETNIGYQQNNWLVEEADLLSHIPGEALQEVGCGNGRYLELAAQTRRRIIGCDWALSPGVRELQKRMGNIEFIACDITKQVPQLDADILVSADVLEHIATQDVGHTLSRLTQAAHWQFHKIACYDDAHSHLTIRDPAWWLAQFCAVSPAYRLVRSEFRLGDPGRLICIISNFPFVERGITVDPLLPSDTDTSLDQTNERIGQLEAEVLRLQAIEQSTTWRMTASLRRLADRILGR